MTAPRPRTAPGRLPASSAGGRPSTLARTLRVDTPEQVELGFELADLGSRFVALLLDGLIIGASLGGLGLLALFVTTQLEVPARLLGWGGFIAILVAFLVGWGYFTYFEGFHNGRTPGKRWAGIRVVHEGSHPLTLRGAAVRNLIRLIDAQPAFSWMVGGLAMMLHPRTQRLGDIAAGTLVVRDRGALELSEEELEELASERRAPPRLTDAAFEALGRFMDRQEELEPAARGRLATRLAEALEEPIRSHRASASTEVDALASLYADERRRRGGAGGVLGASPLVESLVRGQADRWLEYRALVRRAEASRLESLPPDDLERFAALYRLTIADLARARTYGAPAPVVFTLERWVGAGHNLLYRPGTRTWAALLEWLRFGFPRHVRARRWYVAAAAALLFLPAFGSYGAIRMDPTIARELLPQQIMARAETAPSRAEEGGRYVDVPDVAMPLMSSGIIANNVQVTFVAFAAGILAGLGTAALLVLNGVHLGAIVALFHNVGAASLVWEFVAPHGVIELTAICIAGAAGLLLGSGLVAPGRRTRAAALAVRARESVALLAGTTLLLLLAGLVEGFVSPAEIPAAAKLPIAGALAAAVMAYLVLGGRRRAAGSDPAGATPGGEPDFEPAPDAAVTAVPGT